MGVDGVFLFRTEEQARWEEATLGAHILYEYSTRLWNEQIGLILEEHGPAGNDFRDRLVRHPIGQPREDPGVPA